MLKAEVRHATGRAGEEAAARFLQERGWVIEARNWRSGSLELDLVARDGEIVVFVEVRTRRAGGQVSAVQSFGPAKARTFLKAVRAYLAAHDLWDRPCRCDLVCVTSGGQQLAVEHHQHVLELGTTLDRGHAAWQPW